MRTRGPGKGKRLEHPAQLEALLASCLRPRKLLRQTESDVLGLSERISMDFHGFREVFKAHLKVLKGFRRCFRGDYTIENILEQLRREMASSSHRKLPQPEEGSGY